MARFIDDAPLRAMSDGMTIIDDTNSTPTARMVMTTFDGDQHGKDVARECIASLHQVRQLVVEGNHEYIAVKQDQLADGQRQGDGDGQQVYARQGKYAANQIAIQIGVEAARRADNNNAAADANRDQ